MPSANAPCPLHATHPSHPSTPSLPPPHHGPAH
ncbi:hypothetical protein cypCar_00043065 [Cyprinus carpio]|nr:hypothetical protein cypCar_00043065 [Cyprinus carpio]